MKRTDNPNDSIIHIEIFSRNNPQNLSTDICLWTRENAGKIFILETQEKAETVFAPDLGRIITIFTVFIWYQHS